MSTKYLKALTRRGYRVRLSKTGDGLIITPRLSDILRPQVAEHKPELLAELMALRGDAIAIYDAFSFVKVYSSLLNDEIIIAKPGVDRSIFADVVYTVDELAALATTNDPDYIREWHQARKTGDPRPDLTEDSADWSKLLRLAANSPLMATLHGLRCCGARLRKSVSGCCLEAGEEDPDLAKQLAEIQPPMDSLYARANTELSRLMVKMR